MFETLQSHHRFRVLTVRWLDGLELGSGVTKNADNHSCVFLLYPIQALLPGDAIQSHTIDTLWASIYGANWRRGNEDGSRYIIVEQPEVNYPDRSFTTNTTTDRKLQVSGQEPDNLWFYQMDRSGAMNQLTPEVFLSKLCECQFPHLIEPSTESSREPEPSTLPMTLTQDKGNPWRPVRGHQILRKVYLPVYGKLILLVPIVIWLMFLVMYFASDKEQRSDTTLMVLVVLPLFAIAMLAVGWISSWREFKQMDIVSLRLKLQAYCYWGPPFFVVQFPHFRGMINGHAVAIDLVPNGQKSRKVTFSIQGRAVRTISNQSLSQILETHKIKCIRFERSDTKLYLEVLEHLFKTKTVDCLEAMLDLVSIEPNRH